MANDKKVALITGANKGLGLEIARQLGKQDITVVISARDAAKGDPAVAQLRADGIDAHFVPLEVTSAESIAALPEYFEKNFGRLDILINNAGVALDKDGTTPQTFRDTFEVNVIAPHEITQALLPLLEAAPAGRIVNHSSILGSIATNALPDAIDADWLVYAYNASKAALNMLTVIQMRKLSGTNIKINAAHPGWVKTDLGGDNAPLDVQEGAETAVRLALIGEDGPNGGFFHKEDTLPW